MTGEESNSSIGMRMVHSSGFSQRLRAEEMLGNGVLEELTPIAQPFEVVYIARLL
jgi:hypothetical protein